MRRKRLQHIAFTLCHMFCGWRLINSKPQLVELGSGRYRIDVITGKCFFDEREISQLSIAEELRLWLNGELESHNIPLDALERVELNTNLNFSTIPWSQRTGNDQFFDHGKPVHTEIMHKCVIECVCEVSTDETVYRGEYYDVEEWPIGWPAP